MHSDVSKELACSNSPVVRPLSTAIAVVWCCVLWCVVVCYGVLLCAVVCCCMLWCALVRASARPVSNY